jgi:hypothetical protein
MRLETNCPIIRALPKKVSGKLLSNLIANEIGMIENKTNNTIV